MAHVRGAIHGDRRLGAAVIKRLVRQLGRWRLLRGSGSFSGQDDLRLGYAGQVRQHFFRRLVNRLIARDQGLRHFHHETDAPIRHHQPTHQSGVAQTLSRGRVGDAVQFGENGFAVDHAGVFLDAVNLALHIGALIAALKV